MSGSGFERRLCYSPASRDGAGLYLSGLSFLTSKLWLVTLRSEGGACHTLRAGHMLSPQTTLTLLWAQEPELWVQILGQVIYKTCLGLSFLSCKMGVKTMPTS